MMLKITLALIISSVFLVGIGLSGLLFRLWPTAWPDAELSVSPSQIERLNALRREPKFMPDTKLFYPGARNEDIRLALEEILNAEIEYIAQGVPKTPRKSFVLGTFKQVLAHADRIDSEEKDRLLAYFNQIMEILNIHSSNEVLNVWRYGFPYGWFQADTLHSNPPDLRQATTAFVR
jgi:hypothetical protein